MKYIQYERLTAEEKRIYSVMENSLKSFEFQFVFGNVTAENAKNAYLAVYYDHPEFFWLTNGYLVNIKTRGTLSEVTLTPKTRENDMSRISGKASLLYAVADSVAGVAAKRRTPYERALFVHDFIVDTCDYSLANDNCYDAFGCLVGKRAVCAGYSAAFQLILQRLGISCGRIRGSGRTEALGQVNHAWNYVLLNNEAFYVDVTWDDPLVSSNIQSGGISHEYFGLSGDELALTHIIDRSNNQYIPDCRTSRYDYYRVYGLFQSYYSFDSLKASAEKQLSVKNYFSVKFGTAAETSRALYDLIDNQKVFSIKGIAKSVRYSTSQTKLVLTIYA